MATIGDNYIKWNKPSIDRKVLPDFINIWILFLMLRVERRLPEVGDSVEGGVGNVDVNKNSITIR
jgi:hypothetical protein